tara:strand:- start:3758 stop:4000 length:243 start_codon:yes stop_codon:yes gene_type:complete
MVGKQDNQTNGGVGGGSINCPECGRPIGGDTGTSIYKHAIHCLHLPNSGSGQILMELGSGGGLRGDKIRTLMKAAKPEGR